MSESYYGYFIKHKNQIYINLITLFRPNYFIKLLCFPIRDAIYTPIKTLLNQ